MNSSQNNQIRLANRLNGVSESATLKLNATVQKLKSQGVDVVNLTAGEPDFNVPEAAKEAVVEALRANHSKYTPAPGIALLREAVAEKTNRQQPEVAKRSPWRPSHVVVTNGGKQAIYNALMAMINEGDEVLISSPYWLSYPEMVKLAGGVPKIIETTFSQGFKISPEQLKKALGPRVKMLFLNSPSNPTGAIYTRKEYAELANVLLKTPGAENVWVISDEIYDRIILDDIPFCSFLDAAPEMQNRTITVNGMSKSSAMTGWRIGWSVAPDFITQGMITLQGQSTSGINSLAQYASVAALKLPESHFASQIESYRKRRDLALEKLQKVSKLQVFVPSGAFYIYIGVEKFLRAGEDSMDFAQRILEEANVAVVPGTPFGSPHFVRISFATDEHSLAEGCKRLVEYLTK